MCHKYYFSLICFSQSLDPQLFLAPNVEGQIWLKGHSLPNPP